MKQKTIDLSTRQLPPFPNASPSFTPVKHLTPTLTFAGAGVQDLFAPATACTVRRVIFQISAAATIQLLINNEPASPALTLPANALVSFPSVVLPNNSKLQILSTAAAVLTCDIVYLVGIHPDQIVTDLHVSGLAVSSAAGNTPINLLQQASVNLSAPTADAPLGTETAPVVRTIFSKRTTIETITPLAANAVFVGQWHDTELDGNNIVQIVTRSNVASASNGVVIVTSNDKANALFSRTAFFMAANAGVTTQGIAVVHDRYWLIQYTNGAALQATFELTTTASNNWTPISEGANSNTGGFSQAVTLGSNSNVAGVDNTPNFVAPGVAPVPFAQYLSGGRFSGTANANSGCSVARASTIFRAVSTAATGSTAIWTPGTSNKFRLLGFRIQVTALAKAAAAADLVIKLLDAAVDLNQQVLCTIQTTASAAGGVLLDTGWVYLGTYGLISTLVNNPLNVNLSFALTGGLVNVTVQGTEE